MSHLSIGVPSVKGPTGYFLFPLSFLFPLGFIPSQEEEKVLMRVGVNESPLLTPPLRL